MAIGISDFRMAIRIDNSEARQSLEELKDKISALRGELKKMEADGKKDTEEYKAQKVALDALRQSYYEQRKVVGLTGLTYEELRKGARTLRAQMDKSLPDTAQWIQYREELRLVDARMKELRGTAVQTKISLSNFANGFNKYAGIAAGFMASITGVTLAVRKSVDDFAKLEEEEANVRKYTGMTRDEVKDLNEEFKNMDTRTARTRLNQLAGDAGRLGLQGKKDILEFVDAANIINVALGEDLGEDAVKNIGKLATMFGEDKNLGLRSAMLATASAINEVAQNSSAAEPYLVDFIAQVAGASNQAGIAQGNLIGYASVLDQNMLRSEKAATAFQKVMMKMYQEPAKLAKLAGVDVKLFSETLKKDANEALLMFFDALSKKGGLDDLAPIFKELKLQGEGASSVLSVLAGKVDDIRVAQKTANEAYRDGTSAINEYNIQNNTLQAQIDRAKKGFQEVSYQLGEVLAPHMSGLISKGGALVRTLVTLTKWFFDYKSAIIPATVALIAYTATVNASIIADKAKALWTNKIIVLFRTLTTVVKAHPWAAIISLAAGFVGQLVSMNKELDKTAKKSSILNDIRRKSVDATKNEVNEVQQLIQIAKDENRSKEEREKVIKRLNELSPEYLGNLTLEKINTDEATKAVNKYVDSLIILQNIKTAQDKINELKDTRTELLKAGPQTDFWDDVQAGAANMLNNFKGSLGLPADKWANGVLDKYVNGELDRIRAIDRELETLNEHVQQSREDLLKLSTETTITPTGGGGGGNMDDKELKKLLKKKEEELKNSMQTEQNLWKKDLMDKTVTQEEYQQAMYDTEQMFLLSKKALLEKYGQDSSEVQGQIYDKIIAEANRLDKAKKDAEKKAKDNELKDLDSTYEVDKTSLKQAFLNGEIKTEKEFQDKMKELERDYLNSRLKVLEKYGDDTSKVTDQIADHELKKAEEAKKKEKTTQEKKLDKAVGLDSKLDILKAMYDADLISHEEYEEAKTKVTEEHEKLRGEIAKESFSAIGQAASAASDIVSALMDREISKINQRYDKQIKAAKKAGKDTTKLEEEKEEEINAVKKKYADKQFHAAVLQIAATTALAAMNAYASAQVFPPPAGPILGAIGIAAAVATGAAQIAVAKQTRDEARGLKEGGYSQEYVEGYTSIGNPDDVAGVIPVHKNEFVGNHKGVRNPHVKQFYDIFNTAQKNGTIGMINTTQILEQVRTRSGKYAGGYTDDNEPVSIGTDYTNGTDGQLMNKVIILLEKSVGLLTIISEKDLNIDPRKMRDAIKRTEQLEKNVSRS